MLPFEGDTYIGIDILNLRDKFNIESCIETGTQYGYTTNYLCNVFNNVISIEADEDYFEGCIKTLKQKNLILLLGKSEDVLKDINDVDNVLYYLDAHGCNIGGCALKKELEIIALKKHKNCCIAIHDFKVPNTDFGYDIYDYELSYEEIESYLKNIYPKGFNYHYNKVANGANRGIIYIYPNK